MVQNVLLGGFDLILTMKKEVKTKLRQDMTTKKKKINGNKLGT
jgi:hypothetical protein